LPWSDSFRYLRLFKWEPVSDVSPRRAMVLSRGIVGSRGDAATVASPMYKQAFDLRTDRCLDEPEVAIPTYPVRVHEGIVEVAVVYAQRQPA